MNFFQKFDTLVSSSVMENLFFRESIQFLKYYVRTKTNDCHKKVRTAKHWSPPLYAMQLQQSILGHESSTDLEHLWFNSSKSTSDFELCSLPMEQILAPVPNAHKWWTHTAHQLSLTIRPTFVHLYPHQELQWRSSLKPERCLHMCKSQVYSSKSRVYN